MTTLTEFAALYREREQLPLRTRHQVRRPSRKVEPCERTSALTNCHPGTSIGC